MRYLSEDKGKLAITFSTEFKAENIPHYFLKVVFRNGDYIDRGETKMNIVFNSSFLAAKAEIPDDAVPYNERKYKLTAKLNDKYPLSAQHEFKKIFSFINYNPSVNVTSMILEWTVQGDKLSFNMKLQTIDPDKIT